MKMTIQDESKRKSLSKSEEDRPESMGRRAILRGGVTAMPAVLTLHSGAALAASSYTISASSPYTTNTAGRTYCVDKSSVVYADDVREIYDLGDPPLARVNVIRGPDEVQFYEYENKSSPINPGPMCERGGTFYSKPQGSNDFISHQVPQGFVASSGAMTSIADYVKDTLI